MKHKIFLGILLLTISSYGQKQNLVERIYEGHSSNKNPVLAKAEISNEATEKISEGLIKEIIGENKFSRNKTLITQKITKSASRFIPFSRPGELKSEGEGFKMSVSLKISVDDLQKMLLENGLFYEADSTPIVMPLIRWSDRVNMKGYAWWSDADEATKSFLIKENRDLESALKAAFAKSQFYVIRPEALKYNQILSPAFRSEKLSPDDWQVLSQKLAVQIILDGDVQILKSTEKSEAVRIEIKISALQVMNGRPIAEVSRQFETEAGNFEMVTGKKMKETIEQTSQDLASQVFEAWQRGSIGASLYRLTVKGQLPINQQEVFKEVLKSKIHEIKNLKERLISSDEIIYELDSSISPKDLGQKLKEFEIPNYKFVLNSSSDREIIYRLQRSEAQ